MINISSLMGSVQTTLDRSYLPSCAATYRCSKAAQVTRRRV